MEKLNNFMLGLAALATTAFFFGLGGYILGFQKYSNDLVAIQDKLTACRNEADAQSLKSGLKDMKFESKAKDIPLLPSPRGPENLHSWIGFDPPGHKDEPLSRPSEINIYPKEDCVSSKNYMTCVLPK